MILFWAIVLISSVDRTNARCQESVHLEHGSTEIVNGSIVFHCDQGYFLQGSKVFTCDRGIPRGKKPFCAKRLPGGDFESEDKCGWTAELSFLGTWKRVSTVADFHSEKTGPQKDHTFQNQSDGHYVRMETESDAFGTYHFVSPLYPKELSLSAACFQFHYFMFGSGVGSLLVSIKPVSVTIGDIFKTNHPYRFVQFEKTGSQGARWLEYTIDIKQMDEDFQVIFTATDARSQYGDIAIDDVKLMTAEECARRSIFIEPPRKPIEESDIKDSLGYQMADCSGRCGQVFVPGRYLNVGCGCQESCLVNGDCCLNYVKECHKDLLIAPYNETKFWRLWNLGSGDSSVTVVPK
uniref:SR-CIV n=1 Tax=Drosophila simulans TaxID=7240 RepID=Q5ELK3_DROSI|nr:SR-CIV [Drosophila simulans]